MKAEELRLGNLVYCKITCSITHILKEFVGTETDDEFIQIEHIEPILLTEEWLLKCGFRRMKTDIVEFNKNHFHISTWDSIFSIRLGIFDIELKHVHQLQNLYFALTGEELTIKL